MLWNGMRPARNPLRHTAVDIVAAAGLVALVAVLQYGSGAYGTDFDTNSDEPAHVVSSLMVRDYVTSGLSRNPIAFAKDYYIHYPKVAIGHWPPVFHVSEGFWLLALGRSRAAILWFIVVTEALLAISVFLWLRSKCGLLIGLLSASLLVSARFMQEMSSTASPDILLGLAAFWTAAMYACSFETQRTLHKIWAIGLGCIAIGIHGRGAMLLLLPILTTLLLGKRKLPAAAFALIVVAILVLLPSFLGHAYASTFVSVGKNALFFPTAMFREFGGPVAALAAIGFFVFVRSPRYNPEWTVMAALVLSGWIFLSLVNVPLAAYFLVTTAPAAVVLFAGAWQAAATRFGTTIRREQIIHAGLAVMSLATIAWNVARMPRKPDLGMHRLVPQLLAGKDDTEVWLVAGNPVVEGALIAEAALADAGRKHIVLRASKMLASSTWSGDKYVARFPDSFAVDGFLDEVRAGTVVAESGDAKPHLIQLLSAMNQPPWQESLGASVPGGIRVFRRIGPLPPGPPQIRIDMRDKLGTILELHR
jgi:hypothetical protein